MFKYRDTHVYLRVQTENTYLRMYLYYTLLSLHIHNTYIPTRTYVGTYVHIAKYARDV